MRRAHAIRDDGKLEAAAKPGDCCNSFIIPLCGPAISLPQVREASIGPCGRGAPAAAVSGGADELACGFPGSAASLRFAGWVGRDWCMLCGMPRRPADHLFWRECRLACNGCDPVFAPQAPLTPLNCMRTSIAPSTRARPLRTQYLKGPPTWFLLALVGDYGVHRNATMGAGHGRAQHPIPPDSGDMTRHLEEISGVVCTGFPSMRSDVSVMTLICAIESHPVVARPERFDTNRGAGTKTKFDAA